MLLRHTTWLPFLENTQHFNKSSSYRTGWLLSHQNEILRVRWTVPLSHSAWHASETQSTLNKANAGLGGQRLLYQHSTGWRRRVRRQPGLHSEPTSFSSVSLSLSIWFPRAARTSDAAQGILPDLCPVTKIGAKHAEGAVPEWMTRRSRPRRMMQR